MRKLNYYNLFMYKIYKIIKLSGEFFLINFVSLNNVRSLEFFDFLE